MPAEPTQRTYFMRSILVFSMLTMLTVGSLGLFLFSGSRTLLAKEISKDSLHRMEYIRDYLDHTILKRYEELFLEKVVSTVTRPHDGLGFFLNVASAAPGTKLLELQREFHYARMSQPEVSNVTVHFLTSGYTIDADYFYERVSNAADADFIAGLREFPMNRWTMREAGRVGRVLTFAQPLPYGAAQEEARGFLYLDVSLSEIEGVLGGMLGSSNERLYMFDAGGRMLLGDASSPIELDPALLSGEDAKVTILEESGRTTVHAYSPGSLSRNGWQFVVTRPLDTMLIESGRFQRQIVIASIVTAALGLLVSLIISRKLYAPLIRMLGRAQSTRLLKLIHAGAADEETLPPYPEGTRFAVASLRCREGTIRPETLPPAAAGTSLRREAINVSPEELALLFAAEPGQDAEEASIRAELEELQRALRGVCAFGASCGGFVQRFEDIPESYRQAKQAAKYFFLFGREAVVAYRDIEGRVHMDEEMKFDRFENALRTADVPAAEKFLGELERQLVQGNAPVETAEWAFMQLTVCLRRLIVQAQLADRMTGLPLLDETLARGTLQGGLDVLRAACRQFAELLDSAAEHSHAETIRVIQMYIEQHLEEDISLDRVADVVSFSPSYVSKLFAQVLREPFIEYLNRVRLERAAALLRDGDESVTRIAGRVGYSNVQYFCTKFKAKFAATPNQYRKLARSEQEAEAM